MTHPRETSPIRPARSRLHRVAGRLAIVGALATAFAGGLAVAPATQQRGGGAGQSSDDLGDQPGYETLSQTWDIVSDGYVDFENVDEDDLFWGASSGLVDGLGDEGHTRFLDPDEASDFADATAGRLVGVGVQIRANGDEIVFSGVIDGGPAEEAGIQRGDVVLALNGDDVTGLTLDDIDPYFTGVEDDPITIRIYRPTTEETLTFDLVQREIVIDPVSWTMLPGDVALIRLSTFSDGSADRMIEALGESADAGAVGVILDLRDNGGGLVEEARRIVSQFLPGGEVVLRERYADGTSDEYETDDDGVALEVPLTVLTNRNTASAAEFTATALRDNDRATIIGQTTFGTGTILIPTPLDDGSYILLGVGLWESPDGDIAWRVGVEPDVEVLLSYGALPFIPSGAATVSDSDLAGADDAQIAAALDVLAGRPVAGPATPEATPFSAAAVTRRVDPAAMAVEPGLFATWR